MLRFVRQIEKNKEQAKFAEEMLDESKDLIKKKEYDRAEKILLKISNFLGTKYLDMATHFGSIAY